MVAMQLTLCLAIVAGLVVTGQSHSESSWETFKRIHGKQYNTEDELFRRSTFESNLVKINNHNLKHDLGLESFRLGANRFADLTNSEFRALRQPSFNATSLRQSVLTLTPPSAVDTLPDSVDWREKHFVTPVENQGECADPWVFAATGSLESCNAVKHGKLVPLSEQNLLDCVETNNGCNGGFAPNAFEYCVKNGGVDTEASYPSTGFAKPCKFTTNGIGAKCSGYTDVPSKDELALKAAVANVGPVATAVDASSMSFQMYTSGIYDNPTCSSDMLDHEMLVVGYGSEDGKDYWIAKNSWDADWGEKGYIRMSRNKNDQCGIATMASYPLMI